MIVYDDDSSPIDKPNGHLDLAARMKIEDLLNAHYTCAFIARELGVSRACIFKELKRNVRESNTRGCNCTRYAFCKERHICANCHVRTLCKNCAQAPTNCSKFNEYKCPKRSRVDLCNGCNSSFQCKNEQRKYIASVSDKKARGRLRNSRRGARMTQSKLQLIDSIVTKLVRQGQSPYVILHNHPELDVSLGTVYRLISKGLLSIGNIDLQNRVKLKPKKKYDHSKEPKLDPIPPGKTFYNFLQWHKENPEVPWVELDCVEGSKKSSAVLMTLFFTAFDLQIAIKLPDQSSNSVINAFASLERRLGQKTFKELFPCILTDRGTEFRNYQVLETSVFSKSKPIPRTRFFYCNPYRSNEKPHCERNHEYIRLIIPQGTSMDCLLQEEADLMMNHINSYLRSKDNKTPIERALEVLDIRVVNQLHIQPIAPDDVVLKPWLLRDFIVRRKRLEKDSDK